MASRKPAKKKETTDTSQLIFDAVAKENPEAIKILAKEHLPSTPPSERKWERASDTPT